MREALELHDVHQRLALHAAETAGVFLLEHRLDAIDEVDDLFAGLRFFEIEVDAHGIRTGAKLFILRGSHDDHAQNGKFAPHDGQHLEAIHRRHAQVDEQEIEGLALEKREGAGAIVGGMNLRLAGQPREDLLVNLQDVVLVVEDEDFLPGGHGRECS